MLVFNNGGHRPDGDYSSVDELELPVDSQGRYARKPGAAYGPAKAVWSYSAPKRSDFYAFFISGAHRLPNGNTMICSGPNGTLFEVTPDQKVVWKYVNPVKGGFGPGRPGGPGGQQRPNQILASFQRDTLGLSADQKKQVDSLQKTVDDTIEKALTEEQKKSLRERTAAGPGPMVNGTRRPDHGHGDTGDPEADARSAERTGKPPENRGLRPRKTALR